MSDPPNGDKPSGGLFGALRRFARKLKDSARVLRDEYRAGRDEGLEGDEALEPKPERKRIPHKDLGSVRDPEESPPSS